MKFELSKIRTDIEKLMNCCDLTEGHPIVSQKGFDSQSDTTGQLSVPLSTPLKEI